METPTVGCKEAEIKISNLVDYVKECKGIIDIPTKRLLINELAGIFLSTGDIESEDVAANLADLCINTCINECLEK